MTVSIEQACGIWDDLRNAMEGKASHGNETEIYAYRLMPSIPTLEMKSICHDSDRAKAARALTSLIAMFLDIHTECKVSIDGVPWDLWDFYIGVDFDHRAKVKIEKK